MTSLPPPFNAQERDIDLMLLEEMHCNSAFLSWIALHAGFPDASLISARHSVYRENGETDVLVLMSTPSGRAALMIEDKIGAAMQPRQAERYHERGELLCSPGNEAGISSYRTLLCAPSNYLAAVPRDDWHETLSFEDLADWFDKQHEPRAHWRRDTLRRSAVRQRRSMAGTQGSSLSVADETLIKFKRDYRNYVMAHYPEFNLREQDGRDREFYFAEKNFPSYIRLKHVFEKSKMILVFENHWKEKARIALVDKLKEDNLWTESHPSTLHLVSGVEPIDLTEPFENQTDLVDLAMEVARRLLPYAMLVRLETKE